MARKPIDTVKLMKEMMECVKRKLKMHPDTENCTELAKVHYKACAQYFKKALNLPG